MADENYAIRVSFDGIDKAIGDIKTLQTAIGNIKAPVLSFGGADATKIAEASVKKLQLEVEALERKKAQSAANDLSRADQVAAKQEQNGARLLAQLEKQDAVSQRRFTQGNVNGNSTEDKVAIRNAKLYEEQIRLKQQLNAIQNTAFSDADRAKAEAFANSINKINVQKIEKEFAQANVGTRNFIGNMQDASAQLQVLAGKLNEIKGSAQAAFLELDTARKKLSTISDDANGLVKALGNVAKENANQATTAQLAGAAYEVQSAGFSKTADTVKILDASLKGSVGGFSDVTTVSKATISVLNAYGLSADQAAATVDKFTAVQQSGLITVDQYASQISRVAPVAAAAGVSLDQLNGFIATATASGVPVESTFAGLRQALASTIKPSSDATKEAERLGIQFDATALRTKGLNGILADVKNSGLATGDSFSKLFGSIEAVAAIQPAINDLGKLEANIRASGESAGLTQKNFDKAKSTLVGFANEAQNALATLGERINATAIFNPVIVGARLLVTAFQSLPEPIQNIIAIVVGLGASFVAISAAVTGLLTVVTPTIAAFKSIGAAIATNTLVTGAFATATGTAATANAVLAKEVTLAGVATSATAAKTTVATAATNAGTIATSAFAVATKASIASLTTFATTSVSLTVALKGIGGLLVGTGALFGTLAIKAVASITSIIVAIAPLALTLGAIFLAFESVRNTANLFGEINSNKAEDAFDKILNKSTAVDEKLKQTTATSQSFTDKLGGGFDKVENPIQGAALAITNLSNALIGAESGASKFGSSFGFITQQQLEAQKTAIAYGNAITTLNAGFQPAVNLIGKYGTGIDFERKATKLSTEEKKEYQKQLEATSARLKQEVSDLEAIGKQKGVDQAANKLEIDSRKTLIAQSDQKIAALKKEEDTIKSVTEAERDRAKQLRETQNQDAEKNIKRTFDDAKVKQDRENAKAIAAIEEQNALKKGELDRKQALETEALKERQALALQAKQRSFEDAQNERKQAAEQALENRKQAFEARQQNAKQAFEDRLNSEKEARAEKQRKADEAFANARAERDKKASEATSGAKQLISDEGAIATANPEDRAKLAAQLAEENRIRTQAAQQGQGGVQSQEQLVAQAKQLAQVSAIATKEEQAKVQLALDALIEANRVKQAELDKAEDAKRLLAQQESEKAFDLAQQEAKRAFDAQQKTEALTFETSVLKPEKQKIEAELRAEKLAFETGELAAIKKQQAAEERALQLQQTNEDNALKKAADAELEALKIKQKDAELAKDRAFEDAKIERERAFKEQQRALDKASAIEIQQILGKSAQQIISALSVAKGASPLSGAVGVGKVPAFASGVTNFKGGIALVGEQGAELVTLPRGSNVLPANQTKQIMNNNSGGNKTFNVNVTTAATNAVEVGLQVQKELARSMALSM
jgi:hypothetical protein